MARRLNITDTDLYVGILTRAFTVAHIDPEDVIPDATIDVCVGSQIFVRVTRITPAGSDIIAELTAEQVGLTHDYLLSLDPQWEAPT